MANAVLEWLAGTERKREHDSGYSVAPGIVVDNLNVLSEGRVQVHIPTLPSFDPWARVVGLGAAGSRGFIWVPQTNDEVLVAFNENDERDAYILGGLWSMLNRPPISLPTDFLTKRVIQTGLAGAPGHRVEFDDVLQSVTIKTSTSQQIVMDLKQIQVSGFMGTATITIAVGPPPSITIQAATGDINLNAPTGKISLLANDIEITGVKSASLSTAGTCSILGLEAVEIN
jgi:phage baseplate assembly protein gpV